MVKLFPEISVTIVFGAKPFPVMVCPTAIPMTEVTVSVFLPEGSDAERVVETREDEICALASSVSLPPLPCRKLLPEPPLMRLFPVLP